MCVVAKDDRNLPKESAGLNLSTAVPGQVSEQGPGKGYRGITWFKQSLFTFMKIRTIKIMV